MKSKFGLFCAVLILALTPVRASMVTFNALAFTPSGELDASATFTTSAGHSI